jgi:hypothetical protein
MKIALLLSGQPRLYEEVFPHIKKHILDVYDCDVYAHAWWDEAESRDVVHRSPWSQSYKFDVDKQFPIKFNNLYNPKKFQIDKPIFDSTEDSQNIFIESLKKLYPTTNGCDVLYENKDMLGVIHKFISIEKVFNMVDWDENYDWIVFWRYDLRPDVFPDLTILNEEVLYAYTDYWCSWCDRDNRAWPDNHGFIDTGFILHPNCKHALNIKNFYFDECIKNNLLCSESHQWKHRPIPETVWSLNVWYNKIKTVMLPSKYFSASLIRRIDEYGDLRP